MGLKINNLKRSDIQRKIARRLLPWFTKRFLPAKYFDSIYISHFIDNMDFKMLNLRKSIRCFRLGFLPFEYLWFDLGKNDPRGYLPTRNNYQHRKINGAYNSILGNKLLFEMHLKSVLTGINKLKVVDSLGYIEAGYLHPFCPELLSGDFNSLIELILKQDLIIKQISGDGGEGLMHLAAQNNMFYLNGNRVGLESIMASLKKLDGYIIQKKLLQSGIAGDIYQGSVNTMRIGTMIDPYKGEAFIAYAIHRFGSEMSGFVDNVGQGGITARIDLETGRLSMAHHYTKYGEMRVFEKHPSTSAMIFNQEIPNWQVIKRRIIEMAQKMPYLKYVGWDFVLSDDELYVLEGNVSPGLGLVQLYTPMSDYPEAWNFFKYYGYLD